MRMRFCKLCFFVGLILSSVLLNAQSFSVQRIGNGRQAVILIPGFACSGEVWKNTVDTLQKDYSCYVLTMPGFAGVPPEKNPSFDNWAKQIIDFIQKENIERPILIGHSMGGGLAIYIASTHADLVKSIVVVDALPCLAAIYNPDFRPKEIKAEEFAELESKMLAMDDEQFRKQVCISAASLTSDSLQYGNLVKWSMSSDRKTYARMYYDYSNVDLRSNVKCISVPTLVLLEYPFKRISSLVEHQFSGLPMLEIEYAEKGLHFIMFDDWEWYIKQIVGFLNKQP